MSNLRRHIATFLSDRVEHRRLIRFAFVGGSSTLLTLTLFFAAVGLGVWYPLAAAVGYLAGIVNGYTWNMRWTFRTGSWHSQEFMRYALVAVIGLLANVLGISIAVEALGIQQAAGEVLTLVPIVLMTYLAYRGWVFRGRMASDI